MKQKNSTKWKTVCRYLKQTIFFFALWSASTGMAQTVPNSSYPSSSTFKIGIPIASLTPTNTGGAMPNALQGVTDFTAAGSVSGRISKGAFDSTGNFFVANIDSHTILKISPTGVITVFAGTEGVSGNVNATGTSAKFKSPRGIAIDNNNNLFVCDTGNSMIKKITAAGVVSNFAGNSSILGHIDGTADGASFITPSHIVFDSYGNVFVADGSIIRKITPAAIVTTVAGSPIQGSADGTGTAASFTNIGGLTIGTNNTIYVADTGNHKIRKIIVSGTYYDVYTIAGTGAPGYLNGNGNVATFNVPIDIVIDASGNLLVIDSRNFVFRKITPSGLVSTYAFSGVRGASNADLSTSTLSGTAGMVFDAKKSNIYFVEYNYIRKLSCYGYSVSPALPAGLSIDGTGTITGTPTTASTTTDYTITATNAAGSSSKVISITVTLATPTVKAQPAIFLSSTSASVTAAITNFGASDATQHGFVWSTSANPTIDLVTKTTIGAKSAIGSFSSTLTGLTPNTTYYVRGYATNSIGTDYSGDVVFSTNFYPVITPLFNGLSFVFNFAQQSVVASGNLTIRLFGSIFKPNAAYRIRLFSDPVTLATGTVDSNGTIDKMVTLPADTPAGVHHIVLTTVLADNTPFQKEIYLTVGADGGVTTDYNAIMMDIPENTTAVASILGSDNDTPAQALTYTISGGADGAKFSINSATGAVAFIAAPDFESPANAGTDNVYVVDVTVTDSGALNKSDTNTLYLAVTNVAEAPIITTPTSTLVAITGATFGATVASDAGGGSITERGFIYALTTANANPIIGGTGVTKITVNGTTGAITQLITSLIASSSYTFKGYAINATGTSYTATSSVTTLGMNSAPGINYATPQNYEVNKVITTLTPVNVGSAIPELTFMQVSTFAGSGSASAVNATGVAATFNKPMGVTLDNSGNLFVADATSNKIRKIAPTGEVTTIAGSGTAGYNLSAASVTNPLVTNFNAPSDVAVDANGNIFVTDQINSQIRKIASNGTVSVFAGKDWAYFFPFWNAQPGFADGTGTAAAFNKPEGLTVDSNGNLYVADTYNHRIRKITSAGVVTTIAGDGNADFFGGGRFLDGNGTSASFNYPTDIALDPTEKFLYVADKVNQRIRKVSLTAPFAVTTIAGNGTVSSLDGNATAATFNNPEHLALDGGGNVFVTEQGGNKIRKISPNAIVATIAGSGSAGTIDGIGNAATFNGLTGIAIAKTGVAYVTDSNANKVRKVSLSGYTIAPALPAGLSFNGTTGTITGTPTIASIPTDYVVTGYNYYGKSNTTVAITTASLPIVITSSASPADAATASSGGNVTSNGGNVLTAKGICWSTSQNPTITDAKTTEGTATGSFTSTISGLSPLTTYYVRAYATNNIGTSYGAQVSFTSLMPPPSISYLAPNVFIFNNAITPLNPTNSGGEVPNALFGQVSTLAGSGLPGAVDGLGTEASFKDPYGITIDVFGNLIVGDRQNQKIRKITASGLVSTIAGNTSFGSFDATGTAATFNSPRGVAVDASGSIYVADYGNNKIRKISAEGVVSTFAGSGSGGLLDGIGTAARFNRPYGVAVDAAGNVFVTDDNYSIRKITAAGEVTTVAGNGEQGSIDGIGPQAEFTNPRGITVDSFGNLFVTDGSNIRRITPDRLVTPYAVTWPLNDTTNPTFFSSPNGITVDALGNIYMADTLNNLIRKIAANGSVTTIAGSGLQGAQDASNAESSFYQPSGVAVDAFGNVYVADTRNNKIRKISNLGYTISPALPLGLVLDATGAITGTPTALSPATDYTITAYNAGGSSSFKINFAVEQSVLVPTWTGIAWVNGPTTATAPASIEGNYTASGNLEVGELVVKNNAAVTIPSGFNITINGKLTVETGSSFTVENNANLIQTTEVLNSGVISVKRNTAALKVLDYVLWSSPVADQNLLSFAPATLLNRFYTYNSDTDFYNVVSDPFTENFMQPKGYLIRMPNDHPLVPTIWTGTFKGVPNNGNIAYSFEGGKYVAVGNPYPSTIDADAFIIANSISEALYFWRKTNNSDNPSYAMYTLAGGVGTANSADPLGLIPTNTIQVGQGFILKTDNNGLLFSNSMRTANNGNLFLRTKNDKSRIWLNLTNTTGFFSQTLIAYMSGATSGVDAAIDGHYFNDSKTALTSIINNEEFSIQGRSVPFDETDVVALGFKTEKAGSFSLAIDHKDGLFSSNQPILLKDNLTNTLFDINEGKYDFSSEPGIFNSRFVLLYQKQLGVTDSESLSNQVMVYKQHDKIRIETGSMIMTKVKVYDINGRLLADHKNINANALSFWVNEFTRVLLVKIVLLDGRTITKKVIQ